MSPNLKLIETPPPDRLAALIEQRQQHAAEAQRLRQAIERLAGAEQAELTYAGQIAAIEAQEAADVQEWALKGGKGEAPPLRVKERQALEVNTHDARAKAAAARNAAGALRQQLHEAERAAIAVEGEIAAAALDAVKDESGPILDELESAGRRLFELMAKAYGLREPLIIFGHRLSAANPDAGRPHLAWLEKYDARLAQLKVTDAYGAAVRDEELAWFGRIAEISGGILKGLE